MWGTNPLSASFFVTGTWYWSSMSNAPLSSASTARRHSAASELPASSTTAIGTYRFALLGREGAPSYAIISNASANFTILPTDVTRGLYSLPQEEVTKGDLVNYRIERRDGDRVSDVKLLLNGRETTLPRPLLVNEGNHINVSWRVPFEAPNGNYTIRVNRNGQLAAESSFTVSERRRLSRGPSISASV